MRALSFALAVVSVITPPLAAQLSGRAPTGTHIAVPQLGLRTVADSGRFTFPSVPDGRWVVEARSASTVGGSPSAVGLAMAVVQHGSATVDVPLHATVGCVLTDSGPHGPVPSPKVTPLAPLPGTLVVIAAPGDSIAAIGGSFAGEPVYLRRDSAGRFTGFAAVPLDAHTSAHLTLTYFFNNGAVADRDTLIPLAEPARVVAARPTKREALRVAPEFGRAPTDSVARRIEGEAELARTVGAIALATPPLWRLPFIRPRASRITSGFASGRAFNGAVTSRHTGVDFTGAVGDPVMATNRGVVALVADLYLAGTAVYVVHGAGLVSGYFHLSATPVAIGDTVERGQVIGRVGQSGRVTGPHLHWIARYDRTSADPLGLLTIPRLPTGPSSGQIQGACRGSD